MNIAVRTIKMKTEKRIHSIFAILEGFDDLKKQFNWWWIEEWKKDEEVELAYINNFL